MAGKSDLYKNVFFLDGKVEAFVGGSPAAHKNISI